MDKKDQIQDHLKLLNQILKHNPKDSILNFFKYLLILIFAYLSGEVYQKLMLQQIYPHDVFLKPAISNNSFDFQYWLKILENLYRSELNWIFNISGFIIGLIIIYYFCSKIYQKLGHNLLAITIEESILGLIFIFLSRLNTVNDYFNIPNSMKSPFIYADYTWFWFSPRGVLISIFLTPLVIRSFLALTRLRLYFTAEYCKNPIKKLILSISLYGSWLFLVIVSGKLLYYTGNLTDLLFFGVEYFFLITVTAILFELHMNQAFAWLSKKSPFDLMLSICTGLLVGILTFYTIFRLNINFQDSLTTSIFNTIGLVCCGVIISNLAANFKPSIANRSGQTDKSSTYLVLGIITWLSIVIITWWLNLTNRDLFFQYPYIDNLALLIIITAYVIAILSVNAELNKVMDEVQPLRPDSPETNFKRLHNAIKNYLPLFSTSNYKQSTINQIYLPELSSGNGEPVIEEAKIEFLASIQNATDRLNRLPNNLTRDSSYVIGIDQDWGNGKSTLLNLIKSSLLENGSNYKAKNEIIENFYKHSIISKIDKKWQYLRWIPELHHNFQIIRGLKSFFEMISEIFRGKDFNKDFIWMDFEAWTPNIDGGGTHLLYKRFYEQLDATLKKHYGYMFGSLIKDYSNKFIISDIVSNNPLLKIFKLFINTPDQENLRQQIISKLKSINRRIIISIDDIDRNPPELVVETFNLIARSANFPNIIFIPVYHREKALRAYKSVYKSCDSTSIDDKYLDKIVHSTFDNISWTATELKALGMWHFDLSEDEPFPFDTIRQQIRDCLDLISLDVVVNSIEWVDNSGSVINCKSQNREDKMNESDFYIICKGIGIETRTAMNLIKNNNLLVIQKIICIAELYNAFRCIANNPNDTVIQKWTSDPKIIKLYKHIQIVEYVKDNPLFNDFRNPREVKSYINSLIRKQKTDLSEKDD